MSPEPLSKKAKPPTAPATMNGAATMTPKRISMPSYRNSRPPKRR